MFLMKEAEGQCPMSTCCVLNLLVDRVFNKDFFIISSCFILKHIIILNACMLLIE